MALDVRESELEYKFIRDRLYSVGKHFDEISCKLKSYIDKLGSLGNSGAGVAKSISSFASSETCNRTLRLCLGEFSDILLCVQEYQGAQAERLLWNVKRELDNFNSPCKQTKADVKKCFDARLKELKKKDDLEEARSKNPHNWQKIAQAEKEVNRTQEDAARMTKDMERLVERFERKKLEDLQHIFLEFTRIELIYHAKAIELYTKAFNVLKNIKVEEDLHEFISHFKSFGSSLTDEDLLPKNCVTLPKTIDENVEYPAQISHKTEAIKGLQGNARSIFTLGTVAHSTNSGSSSESLD